jgi:signal peptidase II
VSKGRYLWFVAIVAAGVAADLATKQWIFAWLGDPWQRNQPWWLVQDVFGFQTSLNQGALFGLGQGRSGLFAGLSLVASGAILYWVFSGRAVRSLLLTVALALITAGIFGNLYDRLGLHGICSPWGVSIHAVRDWILVRIYHWNWPNFNIADSLLDIGAGLLIWQAYFGGKGQTG